MDPTVARYRFLLHLSWAVAFTLIAWASFCGFRLWVDLERYRIASIEPSARTADTLHVSYIPKGKPNARPALQGIEKVKR